MVDDRQGDRRPTPSEAAGLGVAQRLSATNAGIGVWLILAPFVLGHAEDAALLWNALACGLLLVVLAIARVRAPRTTAWASYVNAGIGGWVALAPFALSDGVARARWSGVASGLLIAALALASASATRRALRRP